jgi:hypothetical protein
MLVTAICNYELEDNESVYRDTIMKVTNNMQLYRLIYFVFQLYMFRAMFSPIIRSTRLYLQYLVVFTRLLPAGVDDASRQQPV